MRPANLLPPDLARGGGRNLPAGPIAAVGAGMAVVVLVGGGYYSAHGKVSKRQDELAALHAQLAAIPAPKRPTIQVSPQITAEKDARMTALDAALGQRVPWDSVLRQLSLVLPDDVWLRTLSAKSAAPGTTPAAGTTTGTAATGLVMTGFTYTQEGVARLLTRLALLPQLGNVQLQSASTSKVESRDVVAFTIAADVNATGGVSQ